MRQEKAGDGRGEEEKGALAKYGNRQKDLTNENPPSCSRRKRAAEGKKAKASLQKITFSSLLFITTELFFLLRDDDDAL